MSKSGGAQKLVFLITGCLVGFVAAYAATYESDNKKAGPVEVSVTEGESVVAVNAKPVRKLEDSPMKGGENPKVIIHEVSEFQ